MIHIILKVKKKILIYNDNRFVILAFLKSIGKLKFDNIFEILDCGCVKFYCKIIIVFILAT